LQAVTPGGQFTRHVCPAEVGEITHPTVTFFPLLKRTHSRTLNLMKHTTSTDLRKNLSALMDKVNDDHEPLLVTRANGKPVLMVSVEDYESLDETAYLLSSPANAKALREAIARVEAGDVITKTMAELEAMAKE